MVFNEAFPYLPACQATSISVRNLENPTLLQPQTHYWPFVISHFGMTKGTEAVKTTLLSSRVTYQGRPLKPFEDEKMRWAGILYFNPASKQFP